MNSPVRPISVCQADAARPPSPIETPWRRRQSHFRDDLGIGECEGRASLIDEIENGVHYSIQEDLWHFILEVSKRLDVQVFATSH